MSSSFVIEQIGLLLNKPRLDKSQVLDIMTKIRIALEFKNLAVKFPVLKLYCDWCLHPTIDRNKLSYGILENLSIMLYEYNKNNNTHRVYEFVSIPQLRTELIQFLSFNDLNFGFLLNDEIWRKFFTLLLYHLIERPLKLPSGNNNNKKYKEYYNQILKKVNGEKMYVIREFSFVEQDMQIYWKLVAEHDHIDILGPLNLG